MRPRGIQVGLPGQTHGMTGEQVDDLRERLKRADVELANRALQHDAGPDRARLRGKAEGVRLALDYLRGYQ